MIIYGHWERGDISIHAPLARCDLSCAFACLDQVISIHAPLARCDLITRRQNVSIAISIHAPLARCDLEALGQQQSGLNFNPRTSCEVRHKVLVLLPIDIKFQSTHLLRGATCQCGIHALLPVYFNPRTSCEVRHEIPKKDNRNDAISIHAPLARCDLPYWHIWHIWQYFNPRTSCEVRQLAIYAAYLLASLIHFREPHFFGWRATMFRFFLPCSLALRTHISFSP